MARPMQPKKLSSSSCAKMAARAEREQCIAQLINVITEQEISFAELTKPA
jgi:hypothetical protein